ncbi:glutaminase A [Salipaludibacillus keqinensis]|jgi:glutaminase|uniref:Glutaminase n=1 Tax=Salipaludibacillus keqinensis TaxID=2045207 RepID=A0A323TE14_9BACI|nr:glutaminase A [Salipaludibacillus keqinensis]PYZ93279.1 glutaminase A [Salipaludibacillus keqinensis]
MSICRDSEALNVMVKEALHFTKYGKVADYIPALSDANPETLSLAIYEGGSTCASAGDTQEMFTLQSISKVITLALALMDIGEEGVFAKVGKEPTGDPFNSIIKLETHSPSKPLNPMINAGALAVTNMIQGSTVDEKLGRLLSFIHELTGNTSIQYNEKIAQSEYDTAYLNRSLAYFLKQHDVVDGNIELLLELYTKQCAIEVSCDDLAKMAYVIANEGRHVSSERPIIPLHIARIIKTFMVTCGMYNASGEFAIKVGVPSKSGVSGGIMAAVPYGPGIGIYGPALDQKGNSIAGMKLLETLSQRYNLSIF